MVNMEMAVKRSLALAALCVALAAPASVSAATLIRPGNNLGLVGWWPLNEGTGSSAGDFSGSGNAGTLENAPAWTTGALGGALSFTRASQQSVALGAAGLPLGDSPYTLSAWIKPASEDDEQGIIGWGDYGTSDAVNALRLTSTGVDNYWWSDDLLASASGLADGNWHLVTATYDGTTRAIYVDGAEINSDTPGPHAATDTSPRIGVTDPDFNEYFDGALDDVRVYDRALSASEVAALYAFSGQTTRTEAGSASLAGWWKLDDGSGSSAADSSGNSRTGALSGSPSWIAGKENDALQFTSSGQYVTTGYTIPTQSSATSFTWSAWVYQTSAGGTQVIMGYRNGSTWVKLTPSAFEYGTGSVITNALPTGRWTIATIVKKGSSFTYYEDGKVVGTASNAGSVGSHTFFIGGDPGFADGAPHYYIDDVRVWQRALSPAEVESLAFTTTINAPASTLARGSTLARSLAGYWNFDGTDFSGTSVLDLSGDGNDVSENGAFAKSIGRLGQALTFNGSSNYLRAASIAAPLGSSVSVCAWVKTAYVGGDQVIWTIDRNPTSIVNEGIFEITSGKLHYWDYTGSAYGFADSGADGATTVTDGAWHDVCFTKSGTAGAFYVDGALDGTKTAATNISYDASDLVIGADYRGSSAYFQGTMDDVRVYDRTLSASEVKQLYLLGKN
jgi:hypothetical protein